MSLAEGRTWHGGTCAPGSWREWLPVAPGVLGRGERLFDGVDDLHGLAHVETVVDPGVTHWRYARG